MTTTDQMRAIPAIALLALTLAAASSAAEARNESYWQERYCRGMELEKHLPSGGYVDCLSSKLAIEVEWVENWAEAVGQSLYYAASTDRKPGIILLCESSETHVEGLCRSYIYRLEEALQFVSTNVEIWECFIDTDKTLNDCFRPQIQGESEIDDNGGQ